MSKLICLVVFSVFFVFSCSKNDPVSSNNSENIPEGYGIVSGIVTYKGTPVGGISITADPTTTISAAKTAQSKQNNSSSSGSYKMILPGGRYTLYFTAKDYNVTCIRTITLNQNESINLDVDLMQYLPQLYTNYINGWYVVLSWIPYTETPYYEPIYKFTDHAGRYQLWRSQDSLSWTLLDTTRIGAGSIFMATSDCFKCGGKCFYKLIVKKTGMDSIVGEDVLSINLSTNPPTPIVYNDYYFSPSWMRVYVPSPDSEEYHIIISRGRINEEMSDLDTILSSGFESINIGSYYENCANYLYHDTLTDTGYFRYSFTTVDPQTNKRSLASKEYLYHKSGSNNILYSQIELIDSLNFISVKIGFRPNNATDYFPINIILQKKEIGGTNKWKNIDTVSFTSYILVDDYSLFRDYTNDSGMFYYRLSYNTPGGYVYYSDTQSYNRIIEYPQPNVVLKEVDNTVVLGLSIESSWEKPFVYGFPIINIYRKAPTEIQFSLVKTISMVNSYWYNQVAYIDKNLSTSGMYSYSVVILSSDKITNPAVVDSIVWENITSPPTISSNTNGTCVYIGIKPHISSGHVDVYRSTNPDTSFISDTLIYSGTISGDSLTVIDIPNVIGAYYYKVVTKYGSLKPSHAANTLINFTGNPSFAITQSEAIFNLALSSDNISGSYRFARIKNDTPIDTIWLKSVNHSQSYQDAANIMDSIWQVGWHKYICFYSDTLHKRYFQSEPQMVYMAGLTMPPSPMISSDSLKKVSLNLSSCIIAAYDTLMIERSNIKAGPYAYLVDTKTTIYNDTTVQNDNTYYYQVKRKSHGLLSPASEPVGIRFVKKGQ